MQPLRVVPTFATIRRVPLSDLAVHNKLPFIGTRAG
jgi:hypothetical protein